MTKLRALPGVESVTIMEQRIGSGWSNNGDMTVDGKLPEVPIGGCALGARNVAGPDFFRTLACRSSPGATLPTPYRTSAHVGMINEEFASASSEYESAGTSDRSEKGEYTMRWSRGERPQISQHRRSADSMAWYMYAQIPVIGRRMWSCVCMAASGDPACGTEVLQQMDPNLPLLSHGAACVSTKRRSQIRLLFARLAGFFAILGVVLVATASTARWRIA